MAWVRAVYLALSLAGLAILRGLAKRRKGAGRVLAYWSLGLTAVYVVWRFTAVPRDGWPGFVVGALLLGAELLGITQFAVSQLMLGREYAVRRRTPDDVSGGPPTVDVFICTYNEPAALLRLTALAALNLQYPADKRRIYLCDDGGREEIRRLAANLGVGYITRRDRQGAKAGNLNNALRQTDGELFAVLDADMLCTREFLTRTVGYFEDPDTAFVQTPQVYYNKDMYQRNLHRDIPNEQDFFMRQVQEARAAVGAVLHVGTNVVFRRRHVEAVGGYPTDTITEDMALGLLLQDAGYKTLFINEMLVLGLTASTYTDLVIQRDRWCRGNLQVTRLYKPLRRRGLRFMQKLAYLDGMIYWYTCFSKMVFILCPLLYLFTGVRSLSADLPALTAVFLPYFLGQLAVFRTLIAQTRSLKWAHYYDIAMAPHMCRSVFREWFSQKQQFSVTPKALRDDRSFFQSQVIRPHLTLAVLTMLGWAAGVWRFWAGLSGPVPLLINIVWSVYNLAGILVCIRVAYHIAGLEPREVSEIRGGHPAVLVAAGREWAVIVNALSPDGLLLRTDDCCPEGEASLRIRHAGTSLSFPGGLEVRPGGEEGERELFFRFGRLDASQGGMIVGLYVEHLRPSFEVEKTQRYLP